MTTTEPGTEPRAYAFLREPKWLALTVLLVVLVPLSALAAHWQFDRWEQRKALNAAVSERGAVPPLPIGDLLQPGEPVPAELEWRLVTATGRYDTDRGVLVRRQPLGGTNGFLVVTPLVTADGVVPVVRGWIPAGATASSGVVRPTAPTGEVTVTGRLRVVPDHGPRPVDLPAGQVNEIDPQDLAGGQPVYDALVELTASEPEQVGLTLIPVPEPSEGPHLSYVGQWILIGAASIIIWLIVVRREAAHRRRTG